MTVICYIGVSFRFGLLDRAHYDAQEFHYTGVHCMGVLLHTFYCNFGRAEEYHHQQAQKLEPYLHGFIIDSGLHQIFKLTLQCCLQASYPQSLISDIFGGFLRSSVHQTGLKDSANVEPFFELHLDVQVGNYY